MSCVFSCLGAFAVAQSCADAVVKKLSWSGQELGKTFPTQVTSVIQQSNAGRDVYLGGLDEDTTKGQLRDDLSRSGLIDYVMIARDRNIGFVHFLSISVARGLSDLSRHLISLRYLHLHKYRSQQSLQNLHRQRLMHLRPQVSTGSYGPLFFSGVRSSCPVCIGSISTSARCARVWLL